MKQYLLIISWIYLVEIFAEKGKTHLGKEFLLVVSQNGCQDKKLGCLTQDLFMSTDSLTGSNVSVYSLVPSPKTNRNLEVSKSIAVETHDKILFEKISIVYEATTPYRITQTKSDGLFQPILLVADFDITVVMMSYLYVEAEVEPVVRYQEVNLLTPTSLHSFIYYVMLTKHKPILYCIATEDKTRLTVNTLRKESDSETRKSVVKIVSLNRYESSLVYGCDDQDTLNYPEVLEVSSEKPVAVFHGKCNPETHEKSEKKSKNDNPDNQFEDELKKINFYPQLVPVLSTSSFGHSYVIPIIHTNLGGHLLVIVAGGDNTSVSCSFLRKPTFTIGKSGDRRTFSKLKPGLCDSSHRLAIYILDQGRKTTTIREKVNLNEKLNYVQKFSLSLTPIEDFLNAYTFSTPMATHASRDSCLNNASIRVYLILAHKSSWTGIRWNRHLLKQDAIKVSHIKSGWTQVEAGLQPGYHKIWHENATERFGLYVIVNVCNGHSVYPGGRLYTDFTQVCQETKEMSPGDNIDNDCDGKIDEELQDKSDNDGDGNIDEDLALHFTVDGGWSKWMESDVVCSRDCVYGVGHRLCNNPSPTFDGKPCEGEAQDNKTSCNREKNCPKDCPNGKYGVGCSLACPPKCRSPCDKFTGLCFDCRISYHGETCREKCHNNCNGICHINGSCLNCPSRMFGIHCENHCSDGCKNRCDISGTCEECKRKLSGATCDVECASNLCLRCSRKEARICEVCQKGYSTPYCKKCTEGHFGVNCISNCPSTCERRCDHVNGRCLEMLADIGGFKPKVLPKEPKKCFSGYFGEYCSNKCPSECKTACHHVNGACLEGVEDEHMTKALWLVLAPLGLSAVTVVVGGYFMTRRLDNRSESRNQTIIDGDTDTDISSEAAT